MNPSHAQPDTAQLLSAMLDGSLDADQKRTLNQRFERGEDLEAYVDWVVVNTFLRRETGAVGLLSEPGAADTKPQDRSSRYGFRRLAGVRVAIGLAAMIALAGFAWFVSTSLTPQAEQPDAQPPSVAMLTHMQNAVFVDSSNATTADSAGAMGLGSALRAGMLRLEAGAAQVMFRSGAVVDLSGPCDFEMVDGGQARLRRGHLRVLVPQRAVGFTVAGPGGLRVVDLGTEFTMDIDERGVSRIYVLSGIVSVELGHQRELIGAGLGAVVEADSDRIRRLVGLPTRGGPPVRLALENGDFESGDLTGWSMHVLRGPEKADAATVSAAGLPGIHGRYAARLGAPDQTVSLRQQTGLRLEPGVEYTLAARAVTHEFDGSSTRPLRFQMILTVNGENIITNNYTANADWQWHTMTIPAEQVADLAGHTMELRFFKPGIGRRAEVWIDQVQLWQGRVTLDDLQDAETEITTQGEVR